MEKLRTIQIKINSISPKTHTKVLKKYAHLSLTEAQELSPQIGMELWAEEAKEKMNENEVCFLELLDENGELITRQKASKQDGKILLDTETVRQSLDANDSESKDLIIAASSNRILPPEEYFVHPLSETYKQDQEGYVNMYGFASMLVNGIRNSHNKFSEDPEKCEEILKDILIKTNPILNLSKTIAEIKMHNLREIMMVCNTVANADMSQFESKE